MRLKRSNKGIQGLFLLFILFIAYLFSLHPVSLLAQEVKVFENLGPFGGCTYDIAIDPSDPNKMFASTYMGDGLFLTTDGGNNWQAVETENEPEGEGTFKNHVVYAVKIVFSDPNIIWVAHNYWVEKSMDGGQTWTHIWNSTMQRYCENCGGIYDNFRLCRSIAIDPMNHNIVYVGAGGPWNIYSSGAIYKTDDGGETWVKLNQGADFDYQVIDIDIDPQNRNVIWAVTSSEGYGGWDGTLYRSSNWGDSWEEIFSWEGFPSHTGFLTIAIKPNDPNTIYTGSDVGIIKHYLEGSEWKYEWPIISDSKLVQDITFDPQNPDILYATWKNPLSDDHLPRVARSMNGGKEWEIYTVEPDFLTLEIHPTNGDIIFGGDKTLGVYKSQDHGQTWTPINNGVNAIIVYDVAINPSDSTHILAGTGSGLFEKKETGIWSRLLPNRVESVKFHPSDSRSFYAGLEGQFAKTGDGGDTWALSETGSSVFDIAIDPSDPEIIFIAVRCKEEEAGQILKSIDGGANFENVLEGLNQLGEGYGFNVVTLDPSNPEHLFAGGGNFYAPKVLGDLWESKDGGVMWTRTGLQDVIVNDILIDPQNFEVMYAGCGYSGGTAIPLYKSTDGGTTWTESYDGVPGAPIRMADVWVSHDGYVFIAAYYGIIFHYDGSTLTEMDSGITEDLQRIWGASATDVFTISNKVILHYDGNVLTTMNSGSHEDLWGIGGISGTDVFAVGSYGTILHYDGNAWAPMNSGTTEHLYEIWGSSGTDVFAVGSYGTILHYDGNDWAPMNSGTTEYLYEIWGSSGTDVFAVGSYGTILHYDGNAWTSMNSGTTGILEGVWGSYGTDVFAVGRDGTLLHYDGSTWAQMDLGNYLFSNVWGSSEKDVFVVDWRGGIYHYDSSVWSVIRQPGMAWNSVTDLEFHPENRSVLYASTLEAGVYLSPNQARRWLNLGTPRSSVLAIATSSLYAATEGGLWQLTGTGVIAGRVMDKISQLCIDNAKVFNDFGAITICLDGEYMMVSPAGICSVTSIANAYAIKTAENVRVLGGDVAFVNFSLERGVSDTSAFTPEDIDRTSNRSSYCFIAAADYCPLLSK